MKYKFFTKHSEQCSKERWILAIIQFLTPFLLQFVSQVFRTVFSQIRVNVVFGKIIFIVFYKQRQGPAESFDGFGVFVMQVSRGLTKTRN
jgi:hypothetical protein